MQIGSERVEEQKYISDLINRLQDIQRKYGDLEIYKVFNEPITDIDDLLSVNEECEIVEFQM